MAQRELIILTEKIFTESPESWAAGTDRDERPNVGSKYTNSNAKISPVFMSTGPLDHVNVTSLAAPGVFDANWTIKSVRLHIVVIPGILKKFTLPLFVNRDDSITVSKPTPFNGLVK